MKLFKRKTEVEGEARKSIMIVDDSKSIQLLIGSLFENEYELIFKEDGSAALDFISNGFIPDLILLDMEMPNMNGRVFLRRLKHQNALKNIPVIFISTVDSRLIINSMIKQGIVDYVVKPFKPEELINKVNTVLKSEDVKKGSH